MESFSLVNGERGAVDPMDRGLAYGDGLFETMACHAGEVRWLEHHLDRLSYGCRRLSITPPRRENLRGEILSHCPSTGSFVVKLIVTRGSGERGYRPPEPAVPTRIVSITRWSEPPAEHYTRGIKVRLCALRLGENPQLAGLKHLCRLEQVLAQMELTGTDAHEGLLRSSSGWVVGGISSNLFAVQGDTLLTPRISRAGVMGVMRRIVLEHAEALELNVLEKDLDFDSLLRSDELFMTNAVFGLKPVRSFEGRTFSPGETTRRLMRSIGYGPGA